MLDGLATIAKRSNGKISIKVNNRTRWPSIITGVRYYLISQIPLFSALWNKRVTSLDYLKSSRSQKKWMPVLHNIGLSISILRRGNKALSIGREATPKIRSLLTGTDDIQIDSIRQVAKLDRDIKKSNENKNKNLNLCLKINQ